MNKYRQYKASEFFKLLEDGEILKSNGDQKIKYNEEKELVILTGQSWYRCVDPLSRILREDWATCRTIKEQIEEVLKNNGFKLFEVSRITIVIYKNHSGNETICFKDDTYHIDTKASITSYAYRRGMLDKLSLIFGNNNYSFEEAE